MFNNVLIIFAFDFDSTFWIENQIFLPFLLKFWISKYFIPDRMKESRGKYD